MGGWTFVPCLQRVAAIPRMPWGRRLFACPSALCVFCLVLVPCGTCRENPKCVGPELSEEYQRDGFVLLRQFLNASQVKTLRDELVAFHRDFTHPPSYSGPAFFRKERDNPKLGNIPPKKSSRDNPKNLRDMDKQLPFDRLYNAWREHPRIKALISSEGSFGGAAARLMGVQSVRLYQDSLFFKSAGDLQSAWHKDVDAAPFEASASQFGTFWISLVETTPDSGNLQFATGSHKDDCSYWDCKLKCTSIEECYSVARFDLQPGDVTFHSGHTFHMAGPNTTPNRREGYAISVFDEKVVLKSRAKLEHRTLRNDMISYEGWLGEQYSSRKPITSMLPILPSV